MNEMVAYFRSMDPAVSGALLATARILVILLVASLLQAVASRLIRTFRLFLERRRPASDQGRIQTLGRVFRYTSGAAIWVIAVSLMLNELGVSVAPV